MEEAIEVNFMFYGHGISENGEDYAEEAFNDLEELIAMAVNKFRERYPDVWVTINGVG